MQAGDDEKVTVLRNWLNRPQAKTLFLLTLLSGCLYGGVREKRGALQWKTRKILGNIYARNARTPG